MGIVDRRFATRSFHNAHYTGGSMRLSLFGFVLSSLVGLAGCVTDTSSVELGQRADLVSAQSLPTGSGSFLGHYVVPASADLASAATFNLPEVDWTVVNGAVTLHYDLPVGLVGGSVPITLSGTLAAGATSLQVSATIGTGSCTASGTVVTCGEAFGNLGTLPISMAVVQSTATADNVSVASRVAIANLFSSDPIGTVAFDLSTPAPDRHGGGGGGGGGGDSSDGGGDSSGGGSHGRH
jgi:hypothetical protein